MTETTIAIAFMPGSIVLLTEAKSVEFEISSSSPPFDAAMSLARTILKERPSR